LRVGLHERGPLSLERLRRDVAVGWGADGRWVDAFLRPFLLSYLSSLALTLATPRGRRRGVNKLGFLRPSSSRRQFASRNRFPKCPGDKLFAAPPSSSSSSGVRVGQKRPYYRLLLLPQGLSAGSILSYWIARSSLQWILFCKFDSFPIGDKGQRSVSAKGKHRIRAHVSPYHVHKRRRRCS